MATSAIDYTRHRAHYNSLVQLNEKVLPQPELAEEFSSNDDASEWTFKIRKDVVFHDGSKLSAKVEPSAYAGDAILLTAEGMKSTWTYSVRPGLTTKGGTRSVFVKKSVLPVTVNPDSPGVGGITRPMTHPERTTFKVDLL